MSKQRKLRNKLYFDEDEAGDAPPPPPPAASKKDSFKPQKSTLLSFGDDEEASVSLAKPKKDKAKVSKFHRANISSSTGDGTAAAAAAPTRPSSGEYTAEKLAALQAATQKLPSKFKPPPAAPSAAAEAAAGSSEFKLSGSFKASKPKDDRFTYSYSITGQIGSSGSSRKDAAHEVVPASGSAAGVGSREGGPAAAAAAGQQDGDRDAMPLPPPPRSAGKAAAAAAAAAAGGKGAAAAAGSGGSGDDNEGPSDEEADGFAMPDKEMIRLAKAKRERLRQAHLAPDYLPLGGASRLLGASGSAAAGASSLGRLAGRGLGSKAAAAGGLGSGEDDEGGGLGSGSDREGSGAGSDVEEELEERMRMAFVGKQTAAAAAAGGKRGGGSSRGAAAALAGGHYATTVQDDHEEEEDEVMHEDELHGEGNGTEQQQRLARAIRRNAGGGGKTNKSSSSWLGGAGGAAAGSALQRDRGEAVEAAGAGVLASLLEAAGRAAARQKHLEQNLTRTSANLAGALEEVERVRADIASTGDKYAAVQALKAYLADLAACLEAKAPLVEEMQDSLQQAREEAAAAMRQQEQDDERILFAQAEAAVAAALAVLGRGGAPAAAAAAAENAAAEAEAAAVVAAAAGNGTSAAAEPQVDEFGRDLSLMRRKELERGSSRRSSCVDALLQQLAGMRQGGRLDLEDTSLQPAAAAAAAAQGGGTSNPQQQQQQSEALQQYSRRRQEVLDLIPTVFADADEQYASLAAVKAKLEGFKAQYPKEYATAYIGESAAALFAPFVRLELLQWEPLPLLQQQQQQQGGSGSSSSGLAAADGQSPGFDTQDWYQQLFEYGLAAAAGPAAAAAEDADANLVPQLVESLVLPLALSLVARCWDPCQVPQSRAVASLVSDLFVYIPADKEDMAQLLALTTGSLEAAVAACAVPPWPAAAAVSPVAQAMLQLRFRRVAALLQGLLGFKELLSQQLLLKLALQGLVGQLIPCLRGSLSDLPVAVARAEAVVQGLPGSWFRDGGLAPREVQPLLDVLASLARSIEQQQQQQQQQQQLGPLARRVALLLVHVGLPEQAQRLGQLIGS